MIIEFDLDQEEAKAVIRALDACVGLYKEDTYLYDMNMRMLGYFKHELKRKEKIKEEQQRQ